MTVIVEKKNDVYLTIDAEPNVSRELSEFFTFEVPGFKFMPAYRNRVWDGKIRLFSQKTKEMYLGLYPYIKAYCEEREIPLVAGKGIGVINKSDRAVVAKFCNNLGQKFEARDYQIDAVHTALKFNRTLLVSPTASGKSFIIYALVRYYEHLLKDEKKNRILIIVPTTSLVEQMYGDFKDYGWNVKKYVDRIYAKYDKMTSKKVVVSTWQSIYNMNNNFFSDFGAVFGDEAHLFKSKSLTSIMTKLANCKYRIGLTGTLDGTLTHKLVLEGLFGIANKVTSTKQLMERKQVANLTVRCLILKHTKENCKELYEKTYQEELEYLVGSQSRNNFISNLCIRGRGNTLCLYQLVEKHGEILYNLINNKNDDRKVFFIHGGVAAEEREKIRAITEKENDAIIIASYGTFSTGVNIRNLHNLIFASPSKSRIRNLQSIGRGLRLGDSKTHATLYDISDDLIYRDRENYTLKHFQERMKIYNEEQFDYEIHNVDLKSY